MVYPFAHCNDLLVESLMLSCSKYLTRELNGWAQVSNKLQLNSNQSRVYELETINDYILVTFRSNSKLSLMEIFLSDNPKIKGKKN